MTERRDILLDFEVDKLTNSIENILTGCDGYVFFIAKTKLIDHYIKTLGAVHVGAQRMVINTEAALKLIDKYFPK